MYAYISCNLFKYLAWIDLSTELIRQQWLTANKRPTPGQNQLKSKRFYLHLKKNLWSSQTQVPTPLREKPQDEKRRSDSSSQVWLMPLSDTLAWCTPTWKSSDGGADASCNSSDWSPGLTLYFRRAEERLIVSTLQVSWCVSVLLITKSINI